MVRRQAGAVRLRMIINPAAPGTRGDCERRANLFGPGLTDATSAGISSRARTTPLHASGMAAFAQQTQTSQPWPASTARQQRMGAWTARRLNYLLTAYRGALHPLTGVPIIDQLERGAWHAARVRLDFNSTTSPGATLVRWSAQCYLRLGWEFDGSWMPGPHVGQLGGSFSCISSRSSRQWSGRGGSIRILVGIPTRRLQQACYRSLRRIRVTPTWT